MQALLSVCGLAALAILAGCGSQSPTCTEQPAALSLTPLTATRDHAAFSPGNQQQFFATSSTKGAGPGCASPAMSVILKPQWTVSDPHNISISSAPDSTNGLATCLGPTAGPAIVTAHVALTTGTTLLTATLFCE